MESIDRRGFIKKSVAASVGVAAGAPAYIRGYAKNKPNETINVAVAGIRSRGGFYYGGTGHTANFTRINNSRVAAICDVDENLFPQAVADIEKLGGDKPATVVDFRELLDNKEIDAIAIATPDHWHALQTIWSCQAGKDVYLEKPVSYTVEEGRKMVQAARKYNRVIQAGTQYRSNRLVMEAIQLIHDGIIGEVYMGRGVIFGHRPSIGRVADSEVPAGVNWDLYRGPAPMIPFNENHFHYNWHWYWDTSTSELGNNGVHMMDMVRWGMKKDVYPEKISCSGGFYVWDSDQEIPNLQVGTLEFGDGKIMEVEVRSLFTNYEEGKSTACFFYGSKGWMHLAGDGYEVYSGPKNEPGPSKKKSDFAPDEWENAGIEFHFVNFLDCMRSRKWQDLRADIETAHLSTSMMHLGNIAYRTGRKLVFDGNKEEFVQDREADGFLTREYREPYVMPGKI
ncbi:MAG: Gfo/Idh/MocA family oxidoreductase [Cyclobacteriaceae bacterium]|nr:Gfo/Idh/MocA family oxidoreductase [Cyclobacteriaceae bacterium]